MTKQTQLTIFFLSNVYLAFKRTSLSTGNKDEKGRSQVDLLIGRLTQILLNFSEGKFWPKGGDSFQTKVFQEYLETHFDMQEFRTFLKENFKDLNGDVEKPL